MLGVGFIPRGQGSEQPGSHSDASADTLNKGLGVPLAGGPIEVLGGGLCLEGDDFLLAGTRASS